MRNMTFVSYFLLGWAEICMKSVFWSPSYIWVLWKSETHVLWVLLAWPFCMYDIKRKCGRGSNYWKNTLKCKLGYGQEFSEYLLLLVLSHTVFSSSLPLTEYLTFRLLQNSCILSMLHYIYITCMHFNWGKQFSIIFWWQDFFF
jgi:hypothetical protein